MTDKYMIKSKIGQGGYAEVYLGRNMKTKSLVAIKVITKQFENEMEQESFVKRLNNETLLMKHLDHENITKVLQPFKQGGLFSKEKEEMK